MKFSEIPKAIVTFTQEQLRKREMRLADPILQAQLEHTKDLLKLDVKNACANTIDVAYRTLLAAPLSSMWKGVKESGSVLSHNFSISDPKKRQSYSAIPAAMITEFLSQWGKGIISVGQLATNLSKALGRTTILGGRYTVGK